MIETLFPLGINHYLFGGLLVGLGISIPYIFLGIRAGVSTVFTSTWSYISSGSFFHRPEFKTTRLWRITLALGLLTGGVIYIAYLNAGLPVITQFDTGRLFLGGILIGIGTRMSSGCTSGHGIMGNASLSKSSLLATVVFLLTAFVVANLTDGLF